VGEKIEKNSSNSKSKDTNRSSKGTDKNSKDIIIRKRNRYLKELSDSEKWLILKDYCSGEESGPIAERYNISINSIDQLVSTVYKKLQNVREIRMLIATSFDSQFSEIMRKKYVDSEHINKIFLSRLSHPEDPLTDEEILFCEFLIEYGIDEEAIAKSKLDVGLKKEQITSYREACKLRAFYLKKKPNIRNYIQKSRQANLGILENHGKDYIQSQLITIIEQLGNIGDKSSLTHQLKALESLAKTVGAFEEKVVIESANGDDALDRLIKRAKEAKAKEVEEEGEMKPIAYVDGQEVYA
jgi:hypothetical protein